MQAVAPIVADSLDKANKKNLKEIETAVVLPQPKDTVPPAIPEKNLDS